MPKNMRCVIFFGMFPNSSFKPTTCFANVSRTTVSTPEKVLNHQKQGLDMKNNFQFVIK